MDISVAFMKSTISHRLKRTALFLALGGAGAVAQAPEDIRVALVVGNAAYSNVPSLVNPTNDAKAMSHALKKLGFNVVDVIDGKRSDMAAAIQRVQSQLQGKRAVAMLYYAGHGLQLDWRNYMLPVDANPKSAADVPRQAVDIEDVVKAFKASGTRMNILVLDACRDNPFAGTAGSGKGLAQMDAPAGTYLAFATAPGNVAEDGDEASGNGLYTQFLLKELQRPASIESVFKRVRLQVRQKSQGRQIPWDSTSLEDEFAFNDGKKFTFTLEDYQREIQAAKDKEERLKREAEAALVREKQLAQQRELERQKLAEAQKIQEEQARRKAEAEAKERERQLAQAAEEERKKALAAQQALERARQEEAQRLKDIELAKAQADEEERLKKQSAEKQFEVQKAEWDKIKNSKNPDDFYAFLQKYPTGYITEQAAFAIEYLQKAKITAQADKSGIIQISGIPRFRVGDSYETRTLDESGNVKSTRKTKVTKIDNGLVYVNDLPFPVTTIDGGVLAIETDRGVVRYDPPRLEIPGGEFSVGKRWTWRSWMTLANGQKFQIEADVKVVAFEEIKIPAGSFKAFKIVQVQKMPGGNVFNRLECWYDTNWGAPLKCNRDFPRGPDGRGMKETFEVTYRQRSPE